MSPNKPLLLLSQGRYFLSMMEIDQQRHQPLSSLQGFYPMDLEISLCLSLPLNEVHQNNYKTYVIIRATNPEEKNNLNSLISIDFVRN